MRRGIGIVGIVVCSLLFTGTYALAVIACGRADVCRAYRESSVIVVGTVTRTEVVRDQFGKAVYERAVVKVTETFKGPQQSEVKVYNYILDYPENPVSDFDLDDAGLRVGETYLIYGRPNNGSEEAIEAVFFVDPCDDVKDKLLRDSRIRTLREYVKRGMSSQGVFEGNVVYYQESNVTALPARGATVRITGESRSVEQIVDRNGGFRFFDLLPGEYKASAFTRDGLLIQGEPFTLSDGATPENAVLACREGQFTTPATGKIDGTIDLPDNRSVSTVLRSDYGEFRRDNGIGYEELPPASYKLLVSSVYSDDKLLVYAHRPLLANIDLKPGQQIEDLEYKFTPPRLRGRSMRVSLMSLDDECDDDAKFELVVAYQNGVTTTFEYAAEQELIFEKAGSVRLKAQCSPNNTEDVFFSQSVTIDSTQPPPKVTLYFGKPKTK